MPTEDPELGRVADWLESELGGRVVRIERQPRWRPVWFADVDRDGERLELCVRGDRHDFPGIFPLEHEMLCQRLLDERGIPVAHVHGWCDKPRAFVMDRVGGSNDFAGSTEAERDAVMDDYMAILARMHQLDVEPFARAGVRRAATPARSGELGMDRYEEGYRRYKKRPDPFLEFCLAWLRRHPLDHHGREAVVVWDSGQFHHRDGRILALLDLELAHIGDPMMDLAAFRMRDTVIGYGDFRALYNRYAACAGRPVDLAAVQHHHIAFTLSNQLAFHSALAEPPAESDYMTNLQWCCETNLFAVEALADALGIELEAVPMPEPEESPVAVAHEHLVRSLRPPPDSDEFTRYRTRTAFRLARHLQRFDQVGRSLVDADLDDLAALLGRRPATWQQGDAALERFVLDDGGAHDAELVVLFNRRLVRAQQLLGPPGSAMTRHLPIQRFA
jgi:aminoglycoside phosphotransferase (APT) family kinase protein